jgi:hypothetical protein
LGGALFVLAVSNITAVLQFAVNSNVEAISSPSVVYDALPSVSPQTNYPSVGFEATSTSEFGDYIHLGGTNRKLNTVTVTMSDWAKYADYASNPAYSGNSSTWSLPVTLNIYGSSVNASGVPTNLLATMTQTVAAPWRPAEDMSCGNTSNGYGWKVGGVCYNFSGISFNAVFDLSGQNVTLPNDVIVGIAFNTQTHGYNPTGQPGPYNSLNVAVPAGQTVSMGSDNSADEVLVNSTWVGQYGSAGSLGVFRKDTGWGSYGTVAMQITANAPLEIAACSTITTLNTTSLSGWYMGETRSTGHNEILASGLHIWTEGATSTDKAAGYYSATFPLSSLGNQTIAESIDYTATTGITPGLQLAVDFDNNGSFDGYLVGESTYGNNWWLSNNAAQFAKDGAPHTGGGNGSSWFGTANEWLNAFPNATVQAIGYSLGSGVLGDGVLKRITLGCTNYTFGIAAPSNLTPTDGTVTSNPAFVNTWAQVEGAYGYEYRTSNTVNGGNLGTIIYSDSTTSQPGRYSTSGGVVTRLNSGTPEGNYYWQVRAIDSRGGFGPWSVVSKVSVDTTAPATPVLQSPSNNVSLNYNNFWFDWSDVSGAVSYEAQFSQSSSKDSNGSLNVGVWLGDASHNQPSESRAWSSGAIGTWYWQVRAVDVAGNKSAWTTPWKVTLDLTAPAAVTLSSPANGAVVNGASVTQSWTASTSSDVDHYVYESYNDAGATSVRWTQTVYGLSKTATNVTTATYWWRVKAVDVAGNESAWSPLWKLTIDNDAPGAPITTSAKPYYTKLGTPTKTLTWVAGANSSDVAYYEYAEYYNTAPISETTPTNWLKTPIHGLSTTDTAWGSNITIYWRVRSVDYAGNKSAWSDTGKIIADVDVPVVTVNPIASSEDTTPTFTGITSEFGGDVTIAVDGTDMAIVTSDANGNWSWTTTTPLAAGAHKVLVTAIDLAGNVSSSDITTSQGYWEQFTVESPAVTQTTTNAPAVTTTQGATTTNTTATTPPTTDGTGILGVEDQTAASSSVDTNDDNTNQVSAAGASDSKNNDTAWSVMGIAWYWWILIAAAIAMVWWLIAAKRRKSEEN